MTKLPQHGTFFPLFHTYLDLGLSWHQAGLVAYISKWNRGGKECFASVEDIAKELRLSYMTMRRVINRSLAQGIISSSVGDKGRARTLKITDLFLAKVDIEVAKQESQASKVSVQSEQGTAQSEQGMCSNRADHVLKVNTLSVQSEQLPRYIPRSKPIPNYLNKNLESVAPRDLFLDWYNSATKEEIQETINQAMSHATRLQVKLLSGPDGSGKISALRNYWESQQ